MMRLTVTAGEQMMAKSSGSQDSLDRVRVSRSNAGSPNALEGAQTPHEMSVDLSDVDEGEGEGETENEAGPDSTLPGGWPDPKPGGKEDEITMIDGGTHVQEMMGKLGASDQSELAPVPIALA